MFEVFVILVEWAILRKTGLTLRVITIANITSFIGGFLVYLTEKVVFLLFPRLLTTPFEFTLFYLTFITVISLLILYQRYMKGKMLSATYGVIIILLFSYQILMIVASIPNTPSFTPQMAATQLVKKYSRYGGAGSTDLLDIRKGFVVDPNAIAREAYLEKGCVKIKSDVDGFTCSSWTADVCEYTKNTGTKARIKARCDDLNKDNVISIEGESVSFDSRCDTACVILITR